MTSSESDSERGGKRRKLDDDEPKIAVAAQDRKGEPMNSVAKREPEDEPMNPVAEREPEDESMNPVAEREQEDESMNPVAEQAVKMGVDQDVSLAACIETGMDNKGHPMIKTVGMTAGDEE